MLLALALVASFQTSGGSNTPQAHPPEVQRRATEDLTYAGEPRAPLRITFEGRWALEAHLSKPHDTLGLSTRLTLIDGGGDRARLDWATWRSGHEDKAEIETTLIDGARVLHRPAANEPFVEVKGKFATILRMRLEAAAPWRTLARVSKAQDRCSSITPDAFAWTEPNEDGGCARTFTWDQATHRLATATRPFAHPRLGDAEDEVAYGSWIERDGVVVPGAFTLHEFDGRDALQASPSSFDVHMQKLETTGDFAQELALPQTVNPAAPPSDAPPSALMVEELDPGVVSFAFKVPDARTFVVEFGDHLVAIDAPLSSALCERIVTAVRERFPTKPLRYVLFGHHHPNYTGGLRAFMSAGATVVTPEGCAKFVSEIAARPFTREPDAWSRAGLEPKIETFKAGRVFEDGTRRLEVIDIGKKSHHTDEYTVFYLPATRVLIQDDIGWSVANDGKLRFGERSRGLLEAITERKLDVQKLWQSWPAASARPSISMAEFESGVKASR